MTVFLAGSWQWERNNQWQIPTYWTKHLKKKKRGGGLNRMWIITGDTSPQYFVTSQQSRTCGPELSDLNWWQWYWVGKRRRWGLAYLPPNSCRPGSIGILYVELQGGNQCSEIPPSKAAATITHAKISFHVSLQNLLAHTYYKPDLMFQNKTVSNSGYCVMDNMEIMMQNYCVLLWGSGTLGLAEFLIFLLPLTHQTHYNSYHFFTFTSVKNTWHQTYQTL